MPNLRSRSRARALRHAFGLLVFLSAAALLRPSTAFACACGCGVFDVGAGTIFPNDGDHGIAVWTRFGVANQNQNWSGSHSAPAANNEDRYIRTNYFTIGGQYMISESWGVMAELPIAGRRVYSVAEDTSSQINTSGLGDMTIMGMYTGLRPDRSIGLLAGVILPTGRFNVAGLERDTQLGTGATQIVLGGYYLGALNESNTLNYFLQARYQTAVLTQDNYRPGSEAYFIAGLAYNLGSFGPVTRFAPVLQAIYQWRASDSGSNSDPANTGLQRAMIAPGIDVRAGQFRLFADVQIPVWQWVRGNQLVPEVLFRVQGSYQF